MFQISDFPDAAEMREVVLTIHDYEYTKRDACDLAYAIWIRFGREDADATQGWRTLWENDTLVSDFMRLVNAYMYTYLRERSAPTESSSPTASGEGG